MAILVVLLAGCTSLTGETARENMDDAAITAAVKATLAAEKASTLTRIGVDTVKGTVYLTGVVESVAIKERAAAITRQVQGVRGVVNNLKVQTG
jgi:osmotically-inducible protein OsmY